MENYKDMYFQLFNKLTDVIEELKEIQCKMEEAYIKGENDNKEE